MLLVLMPASILGIFATEFVHDLAPSAHQSVIISSTGLQSNGFPNFSFQNTTSMVKANGNHEPGAWVAQTVNASSIGAYLTVGGNGFSLYSGSSVSTLPNVAGSGYLKGAAWDGGEFLLVGQHYSSCCPAGGGGVIMYKYYPSNNSLANVTSLYSPSLKTNATLVETAWNGTIFYVLNMIGEEGGNPQLNRPLNLYSYNTNTNALTNLTNLLPTNFRSAGDNTCCNVQQELLYTPSGLFLLLQTVSGPRFGILRGQSFTDLTSRLPANFILPNNNGEVSAGFGYLLAWTGSSLFFGGRFTNSSIAVFSYNPISNLMTNYSHLYSAYSGTPVTLTGSGSGVYLSGFSGASPPLRPFLTGLNTSTLMVSNLTSFVPISFGPISASIVNGQTVFIAGGAFNAIQYGLLKPIPPTASSALSFLNLIVTSALIAAGFSPLKKKKMLPR